MKSRTLIKNTVILACLLCFFLGPTALAGTGDGTGGGTGEPLALVNSLPADGQRGVPVGSSIDLEFSKNVINMGVKDNNAPCFKLYQGQQQSAIKVVMADDQIEPEKKRLVSIVPEEALEPGTTYTLRISGDLTSKSGVSLGREVKVSFTTAGTAAVNTSPSPETTPRASVQEEVSIPQDTSQAPVEGDSVLAEANPVGNDSSLVSAGESGQNKLEEIIAQEPVAAGGKSPDENDGEDTNYILIIALIVVICAAGIYFYFKKYPSQR